jgi:transketolase
MTVWRPCDTVETAVAWAEAIEHRTGPSCLLFTRQNVPFQKRDAAQIAAIRRGGYVLADWSGAGPKRAVIIATGSEVGLAMGARDALKAEGVAVRVVSMPSTSVFDAQDASYRAGVLPRRATRCRGSRRDRRLAQVCGRRRRRAWSGRRNRHLRRVGTGCRSVQVFRLHRGERDRGGQAVVA